MKYYIIQLIHGNPEYSCYGALNWFRDKPPNNVNKTVPCFIYWENLKSRVAGNPGWYGSRYYENNNFYLEVEEC